MLLTVIIPVYQSQATLSACVESVVSQDISDMEVILVDDGSTDNSPAICDEWAQRDSRIHVVHKPNGGPSSARNAALDIANGEYLAFIDSDDTLLPHCYATMLHLLKSHPLTDITEFQIDHQTHTRQQTVLPDSIFTSPTDYWLDTKAWQHAYLCNKIIRATLFKGIRLPVGKIFEDLYVIPLLLRRSRHIATTNRAFYIYNWTESGLTATARTQRRSFIQHIVALLHGARVMHTWPWTRRGSNLYYTILCRIVDITKSLF